MKRGGFSLVAASRRGRVARVALVERDNHVDPESPTACAQLCCFIVFHSRGASLA